jgi:DNA replication protein DnaC
MNSTTSSSERELAVALEDLGLRGMAATIERVLTTALKQRLSPVQLLEELIRLELQDRLRRSLERRESRAKIGAFKPMADFDWNWLKELNRALLERVLGLGFLEEGANVILLGPHGLGKTMLLKNIAHNAVLQGHSVLYTTAAKMLTELSSIDSPSKLEQRIRHYTSRVRLLCLDELGYLSYDSRAADLLFEVVTRRYEAARPIALTTNLAFADWTQVFPHATCTVALVDRLTHRADIIKLEGTSWRLKEAQERRSRQT